MTRHLRWVCPTALLLAVSSLRADPTEVQEVSTPAPQARAIAAWEKLVPAGVEDLRGVERRLREVLEKVRPATVHVQVGFANGSGVIVSKEGHVLTAAHVSGDPGQEVQITFSDGRRVKGESLGRFNRADAGLLKIVDEGDWPVVEMGKSAELEPGQWCFALGHPNGFDLDRGPVLRIGRVISVDDTTLWTDCTILGGDSGGPLFDMSGRVVGIHSRIARPNDWNFHAPIDAFQDGWEKMAAGEVWSPPIAELGVNTAVEGRGAQVMEIKPGSAAERAGLRAGDIILSLNDVLVSGPDPLGLAVRRCKPEQAVKLRVLRADKEVEIEAVLGTRSEP